MKKLLSFCLATAFALNGLLFSVQAKEFNADEMANVLSKLEILHGDASKGGDYDFYSLLTRAQFTKLAVTASLYKNMVPVSTNTSPYSDVPRTHWAAGYIKTGVEKQLIKGYPDSTFRPEANVLLEEGVTIALKLLGYENSDFGGEWPNGQMGIAHNIGLLKGIDAKQGNEMNRLDAITLLYHTLNAKTKAGKVYMDTLGYSMLEDTILIASYRENEKLDAGKVSTSNGTFKVDPATFPFEKVGRRGDFLIKDGTDILGFYPESGSSKSYVVTSILGNDILVDQNGTVAALSIKAETAAYYNASPTTYGALASKVAVGDVITVESDELDRVKYVSAFPQKLEGPVTVVSPNFINELGLEESNVSIIKSGGRVSAADVKSGDILYYSKTLNTIWVYSDKKTGIYDEAKPNQEFPTSIVLSGTEYQIESAQALSKLAANGQYRYGQNITLLLGKDGKIADVISGAPTGTSVYAYVLGSGTKDYTINGKNYTSYYLKVTTPSGDHYEYVSDRYYDHLWSKVVRIDFEDGVAKPSLIGENTTVYGTFDAVNYRLSNYRLAANVKIIDVKHTDSSRNGEYIKVHMSRLTDVTVSKGSVLYAGKNDNGEINELILDDVTGDTYQYGMMVKATLTGKDFSTSGSYTYNLNGKEYKTSTNSAFNVKSRAPARLDLVQGQLNNAMTLNLIDDRITSINESSLITASGKKHLISDSVSVFYQNSDYDYMILPLSDVINNDDYQLTAYYDKVRESGGRVRVILAKKI